VSLGHPHIEQQRAVVIARPSAARLVIGAALGGGREMGLDNHFDGRRSSSRFSAGRRRALAMAAVAAAVPCVAGRASAATATWTGAIDNNWNSDNSGVDSNWTGGAGTDGMLASNDSAAFVAGATNAGGTTLNDNLTSSSFNISGFTFGSGAPAYTIGGNAFNLTGGITNSGTSLQSINDAIGLAAVQTVTLTTGGGNVSLGGSLTGAGGITTAGAGTLTLGGANGYTGNTSIGAGTVVVAGSTTALGASTGGLTISGGTLNLNGNNLTKGTLVGTATGSVVTSATAAALTVNYTNTAGQYANLNVSGGASLIINGTSGGSATPFGTGTLITGTGSLGFQYQTGYVRDNNIAANLGTSGSLLFNNGGQFQNSVGVTVGSGNGIIVNGTGNVWNYSVNTSGTGATANGAWTGSGTITLDQGFNCGFTAGGDMSAFSGTLNVQNLGAASNNTTFLSFTNTTATVAGSSLAIFTQSAFSTGNTGTNYIQWAGTGNRVIALGDLSTSGAPSGSFSSGTTGLRNTTANTTATFQVGAVGNNSTYAGNIINGSGTAITAITKVGGGTWTLTGTNTYSGGTNISSGTLLANNATESLGTTTANIGASGTLGGGTTSTPGVTGGPVAFSSPGGGTITAGNGTGTTNTIGSLVIGTATTPAALSLSGTDNYYAKVYETTAIAAASTVSFTSGNVSNNSAVLGASDQLLMSNLSGGTLAVTPVVVSANASNGSTAYNVVIARATTAAEFDSLIGSTVTLASTSGTGGGSFQLAAGTDTAGDDDLVLEFSPAATPEPTSLLLAGIAAAPLALGRWRRRSR
jgi:fibronectin-binding autotransporter adhesin